MVIIKENKNHKERKIGKRIKSGIKFIPSVVLQATAGAQIGKAILNINSESKEHWEKCKKDTELLLSNYKKIFPTLEINTFQLNIDKKTSLSSVEIKHKDSTNPVTALAESSTHMPKENILVFMGNILFCEKLIPAFCRMAVDYDANIISFNYRGKGNSTGFAKNLSEIVSDGKAQVDRLINQGVLPQNITLYGQCFGGSVATLVANELHKEGKKVYLFNDRSYSKISKILLEQRKEDNEREFSNPEYGKIKRIAKASASKAVNFFIVQTLNLSGWNENAGKAFMEIPDNNADYIVIQNSKKSKGLAAKENLKLFDDGLIPEKASLHYYLREKRKKTKQILKDEQKEISSKAKYIAENKSGLNERDDNTVDLLTDLEKREKELQSELLKFKERKMIGTINNNNETYSMLQRKQGYIKVAKEIKRDFEDLYNMSSSLDEINEKLELAGDIESRKLIIKEKNEMIKSFVDGTYEGLNKSIWDIIHSYPQRKKITRKEFDDIYLGELTGNYLNTDNHKDDKSKDKRHDVEELIDEMLDRTIKNYSKLIFKITGKEIKDNQDFYKTNFLNEGTEKINHNRLISEVVSRVVKNTSGEKLETCDGKKVNEIKLITGYDYFKEFIDKHREVNSSAKSGLEMP